MELKYVKDFCAEGVISRSVKLRVRVDRKKVGKQMLEYQIHSKNEYSFAVPV